MVTPPHHRQGSDRGYHSRPHSRSHSSLGNGMSASYRSESPDAVLVQYSPPRPNSVPMPAGEGQTEGEEATEGQESDLVPDPRLSMISFTSSTGDSVEQTEALRKALAEMTRRAAEQERTLQEQLAARELDIEDIQAQLENTRDLISMLKKDEKEWRSKEVSATMWPVRRILIRRSDTMSRKLMDWKPMSTSCSATSTMLVPSTTP
jgi:hypothetical protein